MKIGDNNGNPTASPADLFSRMEEAHRESKFDIGAAADDLTPRGVASTDSTSAADTAGSKSLQDPVQNGLLEIARRAIHGEFTAEADLRQAVVNTIVTERYARDLQPEQVEQITKTLGETLIHDPSFRQEIERMLLLAARQLARAERG